MQPHLQDWYVAHGYTLMSDARPLLGERFQAARIVCERGFGAVILRTRRILVPAQRIGDCEYLDELNGCHLAPGEIEAWMPAAANPSAARAAP